MLYTYVVSMLGGSIPSAYAFIAYIVSGVLLILFSAVALNFFGNLLNQFFFKS